MMAIMVNEDTKVLVQGITGKMGSLHTKTMLECGTKVVAGVRPGAEGQEVHGVPVFNDAKTAVQKTGANAAILFVPPSVVKNVAIDTMNAGVKLIVVVPESVPVHDTMEMIEHAKEKGVTMIGPNTAGMIAPELKCKIGFVPNNYFVPGPVGLMSRSGTLMYEITSRLTLAGIGQSTCVGVGGDGVVGIRFPELLKLFEKDKATRAIMMVCELGGTQEEEAAALVKSGEVRKPVVAFLAGYSAPKEKRIGHAGAIVSGNTGTIENKLRAFDEAGIAVAKRPGEIAGLLKERLG